MGLFKKKEKGVVPLVSEVPKLPEFPKLPELPGIVSNKVLKKSTHKLPSYPSTSLGEKFSQDTIKEAITGEKEDEGFGEDEFAPEEFEERMIPKPPRKSFRREFGEIPKEAGKAEPIFIRIDKFEVSLKIFENAKKQISEIENMLEDIKKIKEDEDIELTHWEKEIQSVKEQIERIDRDVFSKIE